MITNQILLGDALTLARTLPNESVNCIVTSPPYWGLRDYGVSGQLGLEPTYQQHIAAMVELFNELKRALRADGTLWLNYGDCYATERNGRSAADTKDAGNDDRTFRDKPFSTVQGNLKRKDLVGMPWRIAFALQDAGWYLRSDIIWHKTNPMPESTKDRPTKAHEYLFLLTKSERYYYDYVAIKEPATGRDPGNVTHKGAAAYQNGDDKHRTKGGLLAYSFKRKNNKRNNSLDPNNPPEMREDRPEVYYNDDTRNKRSVWSIATAPYPDAHFATFPPALIEPCVLAGCPEGGIVLDPFMGSGTTAQVAIKHHRNWLGFELNPEYIELAYKRIAAVQPVLFT